MNKKLSLISKNHEVARNQLRNKQDSLESGNYKSMAKVDENDILHSIRRQKSLNKKRDKSKPNKTIAEHSSKIKPEIIKQISTTKGTFNF